MQPVEQDGDDVIRQPVRRQGPTGFVPFNNGVDGAEQQPRGGTWIYVPTKGIVDAASRLEAEGHKVLVADQYEGRTFDDYEEADKFTQSLSYRTLMGRAEQAVAGLPDGFIAAGFSNGGGMAEFVATKRPVSGVLMLSGALDLALIGASAWPTGVPAQIHYTADDPFRNNEWINAVAAQVRSAGASVKVFDYPGAGHLFTDSSMTAEYDKTAADLLWSRVLSFCAAPPH